MEYSDFDCSFCAKYATEIYPLIDENYIKPGKVKYFFRDMPSPEHPNALFKARLARCAGEQGKFWEMHDRLFANPSAVDGQEFAPHAQGLGLDAEKLRRSLASDRYTENIRNSTVGAARMGIRGTPAFLIGTLTADGDFLRTTNVFLGAESYPAIKSILDELLTPPTPPPTK
jgi:protein-disulfide isomerase